MERFVSFHGKPTYRTCLPAYLLCTLELRWLTHDQYGRVFQVFDAPGSGNFQDSGVQHGRQLTSAHRRVLAHQLDNDL